MRAGQDEHALRCHRPGIGGETHPWNRDLPSDILLGHEEVHDLDAAIVLHNQVHGRLLWGYATHLGDLGQSHACQRLQLIVLETDEECTLGTGRQVKILPIIRRRRHFSLQPRADGRILKTLRPRIVPTFLDPGRHRRIQTG